MADSDKATKEKTAFDEFKKRMKGDLEKEMYEDDNMFYRFLKARDFKVDDSEKMLREHLLWRKEYDIENISKWDAPEVLTKYFGLYALGFDKEGALLKYNHFANTDFRGLFEACAINEWRRYLIYLFEDDIVKLKQHSKKIGRLTDKVVYIENCENFSLAKATDKKVISNVIISTTMYLNNYPETLKAVYVINAPVYFNIFFSVVKAFLPSTVVKKIHIYSDDSWRRDLLDVIDADILPAFLGGKRTDPDGNPLCLTIIPDEKSVPKSLYRNKKKKAFPNLVDAEKVSISRGSIYEVLVKVTEPGSHLEWEFEVKSGDIKFGLSYKEKDCSKTELMPFQKISADEDIESGLYKCEKKGNYIVIFDNTYSYFKSKDIYYKINVKNPQEQMSTS